MPPEQAGQATRWLVLLSSSPARSQAKTALQVKFRGLGE